MLVLSRIRCKTAWDAGLGCSQLSFSKILLYKEYSCLIIEILFTIFSFAASIHPLYVYSIPITIHRAHMSEIFSLFLHPPRPPSFLTLQVGRIVAVRPASARVASAVAGLSGSPHSAACLLRALRLPACGRQAPERCRPVAIAW